MHNPQIDKFTPFKTVFESVPNALKVTGTAGSFCGFIYLFAYARSVGIPFPLELSVLPTILLLVGMTSVIGTILLVGGILVPALLADEPISVSKSYFLADDLKSRHRRLTGIKRYFLTSWAPMAIEFFALMFASGTVECEWKTELSVALLVAALVWIVSTSFIVDAFKGKQFQYILSTCVQTLSSLWAYCLAMLVFIALYPQAKSLEAFPAFFGALGIFTLIHMLTTLPHRKGTTAILLPPYFEYEVTPTSSIIFVLAGTITVLSLAMAPISAKVGKAALYAFGVGGGVPIRLCLKNKPPAVVAERIAFSPDNCSEVTSMLFDAGDKVYVAKTLTEEESEKDDVPTRQEFFYFRQDEIREKVYPPPVKNAQMKKTVGLAPIMNTNSGSNLTSAKGAS